MRRGAGRAQAWLATHISSYIAIAGANLGAAQSVKATFTGLRFDLPIFERCACARAVASARIGCNGLHR